MEPTDLPPIQPRPRQQCISFAHSWSDRLLNHHLYTPTPVLGHHHRYHQDNTFAAIGCARPPPRDNRPQPFTAMAAPPNRGLSLSSIPTDFLEVSSGEPVCQVLGHCCRKSEMDKFLRCQPCRRAFSLPCTFVADRCSRTRMPPLLSLSRSVIVCRSPHRMAASCR